MHAHAGAGDPSLQLFGYWRSSAAYRVRIGLNLKRLEYAQLPVHLVRDGGEQHAEAYRRLNPQALVPTLRHGERVLTQSLAILEYLDEVWPQAPLLPADPAGRVRVRALAQLVACDIHPLNNLRVMQRLEQTLEADAGARTAWMRHWMREGFDALEALLAGHSDSGRFCHGDSPGLADCCLLPQLYNAHRFGVELQPWPTLARIEAAALELDAVAAAHPDRQPDALPG